MKRGQNIIHPTRKKTRINILAQMSAQKSCEKPKPNNMKTYTVEELKKLLLIKDDSTLQTVIEKSGFPLPQTNSNNVAEFDEESLLDWFRLTDFSEPFVDLKTAAKILGLSTAQVRFLADHDLIIDFSFPIKGKKHYLFIASFLESVKSSSKGIIKTLSIASRQRKHSQKFLELTKYPSTVSRVVI